MRSMMERYKLHSLRLLTRPCVSSRFVRPKAAPSAAAWPRRTPSSPAAAGTIAFAGAAGSFWEVSGPVEHWVVLGRSAQGIAVGAPPVAGPRFGTALNNHPPVPHSSRCAAMPRPPPCRGFGPIHRHFLGADNVQPKSARVAGCRNTVEADAPNGEGRVRRFEDVIGHGSSPMQRRFPYKRS